MGVPHAETRRHRWRRAWSSQVDPQPGPAGWPVLGRPRGSDQLQVAGRDLALARVVLEVEADLPALIELADAGLLERADMHEHIGAAGVGLDEAEALGRVEPLNGAGSHCRY